MEIVVIDSCSRCKREFAEGEEIHTNISGDLLCDDCKGAEFNQEKN